MGETTKALITVMVIVAIVAVIAYATSPSVRFASYGYRSGYAASAYDTYPVYNSSGGTDTSNTVYSIHRSIPSPHTSTVYTTPSYYYGYGNDGIYSQSYSTYPDGCDATTLYSATTGMPCNSY